MQKAIKKWTEFLGRPTHPKRSDMRSEPSAQTPVIMDVAHATDIQASSEGETIDIPTEWDPILDPEVPADETMVLDEFDPSDHVTKQP